MRRAADGERVGPGGDRRRRAAAARTCLVLALAGSIVAVLPTGPADGLQHVDATATTVPSSAPEPLAEDGPAGGEQPTLGAEGPTTTTLPPTTTTTTTTAPAPALPPELAQRIQEVLEDLAELSAAHEEPAAPFLVEPFRDAVDEALATTTTTSTVPPASADEGLPHGDGGSPTTTATTLSGGGGGPPTSGPPTTGPTTTGPPTTGPPATTTTGPGSPTTTTTTPPPTTTPRPTTMTSTTTTTTTTTTRPPTTTTPTTRPPTTTTRPPTTTTTLPPLPAVWDCSTPAPPGIIDPTRTFFVFDGQSNTLVPDAESNYPTLTMRGAYPGAPFVNVANAGTEQTWRTERAPRTVDLWANASTRPHGWTYADRPISMIFNEGGSTDLSRGVTADEMIERTRAYAQGRRAAGFDIIVQAPTLPAAGFFSREEEIERRRFHNRLCREYKSLGIDGIVDPTTLPALTDRLGAPPYWAEDGVHLSAAGARAVADKYIATLLP